MQAIRTALFAATLVSSRVLSHDIEKCKFLDLSHEIKSGVPHWGDHGFEMTHLMRGPVEEYGIEYVESNLLKLPEHFGTHVDTPSHFMPRPSQRTEKVPLDTFFGPACVIDVTEKTRNDKSYAVTTEDIFEWEEVNGKIPRGCIVLIYTGWEFKWENPKEFLGVAEDNESVDLAKFNNPGVSEQAASLLVYDRHIRGLGIDTVNFDPTQSRSSFISQNQPPGASYRPPSFHAHRIVLGNNIPGYENLNNLHLLPPKGATVSLAPMKVKDGSGGPIRGWAIGWDGPNDPCRRETP